MQGFNWTRFVRGVLSSVGIDVRPKEELVVYGFPYLQKLSDVLVKHDTR